jgi:hypothetical protein
MTQIKIRNFLPTDINFLTHAWTNTYERSRNNDYIRPEKYKNFMAKMISATLNRAECKVACSLEDPNEILGFAVYEDALLHFVYVKTAYRTLGVATALLANLNKENLIISHETNAFSHLKLTAKFKPFTFFTGTK